MGVRLALGARRARLVRQPRLGVGLAAARGLTRLAGSLLFGVSASDPLTYAAAAALLTAVASAACYVPACRARRCAKLTATPG